MSPSASPYPAARLGADRGDLLNQYHGRAEPDTERGDSIACCKRFLAELGQLDTGP